MSEHKKNSDKPVHVKTSKVRFGRTQYKWAIIIILTGVVYWGGLYLAYNEYKQLTTPPSTKAVQAAESMNKAIQNHNTSQALADAKKALANEPNNVDNILAVAYLTQSTNPSEAKQYFKQALDLSNKQDNANVPGKSAITYWGAANLAQQAGETDQAKIYYQEVIKAAVSSNSYQQSLAVQSQAQLRKLK
jgi:tetratricopeptide (TPR) repeat protein